MSGYVVGLHESERASADAVGGKGARLAALMELDGIRVPDGFVVTTDAFLHVVGQEPSIAALVAQLSDAEPGDREAIRDVTARLRAGIEAIVLPDHLAAEVASEVDRLDDGGTFAVRSSATAEDLPTASFAGQHDTFLDIPSSSVVEHVRRCWASLFTDRAVDYRHQLDIDHRAARMAVIVQRMVPADAAGILFTADPVTGHRGVCQVEASPGLGEAVVSGRLDPDRFEVRDGQVVGRALAMRERAALADAQVLRLVELGRRVESHLGSPQDIEWCLAGDDAWVVQSRPITTLFPVPEAGDDQTHVYVSTGHQQMMTDAMKPLGLSFWQLTTPARTVVAGSRIFVDVTHLLASPATRDRLLELADADPLVGDALRTVVDRGIVAPAPPDQSPASPPPGIASPIVPAPTIEADPAVVDELVRTLDESIAVLERDIDGRRGSDLLDFIRDDIDELRRLLFDPRSHQAIMAGMEATSWLNDHLRDWLGLTNAADALTQSAPNNVTSRMGLALLDVADVVRPHARVVDHLRHVQDGDDDGAFLDRLAELPGGPEAAAAIRGYLDAYGMRCVGEIDITRPRWGERPTALVPMILTCVDTEAPGAAARRFERGLREAADAERTILDRLVALPDGPARAAETKAMIDRLRTFIGYREYPKYFMITRYGVYRRALLQEAERLARAGVLSRPDDIGWLTFEELRDVVRSQQVDADLLAARKAAFLSHRALTPPRVMTSDGETIVGRYRRDDVPPGALVGLAVSAGTVEGRARVVSDMAQADLEPGDILVTAYADPSWTPAFVVAAALVTEVGGLMTHGAVVAREYGLPAVVGVERATQLVRDGQRIRVNGTDGWVELLT